ncbi:MAG: HDOD domain-containing protein [Planctomycetaceae bacterium]|jgi:HD-like signal output (HDOD) protein|nr:HDOD domain-containing protein [Planctomycetaceae bacterium]
MTDSKSLDRLRKLLTVEQLPAMPHSALRVLQLDNDLTKVNINDLVRPIEADPGLAAQVLKFLNSSYFGFQSTISNVKQGIALVGIRIVKNFVLWKAVFSLIPKNKLSTFNVNALWQDSLRRAMFTRFVLLELKKGDPELSFAGALLQDMAIPLLIKQQTEDYDELLNKLRLVEAKRLSELEIEHFGWTHADAGGVLGRNWKLPDSLTELIESHLDLDALQADYVNRTEQYVVALSSLLPSVVHKQWYDKELFLRYMTTVYPSTEPEQTDKLLSRVDAEFDQYAMLLQLAKPSQTMKSYL